MSESNDISLPSGLQNLTGQIRRTDRYPFAFGGNADVWMGIWIKQPLDEEIPVAIKTLRVAQSTNLQPQRVARHLAREATVWIKLRHEHILPFFGIIDAETLNNHLPSLISEYCPKGTVNVFIQNHPLEALRLVREISRGLEFLHSQNDPIIHGDLKGANVLVDANNRARITDFGLSRILSVHGVFTTASLGGTTQWTAPELLLEDEDDVLRVTMCSDVYAFAMTAVEVFSGGKQPFAHAFTDYMLALRIVEGVRPIRTSCHSDVSVEVWTLLEECWVAEPNSRPQMSVVRSRLDTASS